MITLLPFLLCQLSHRRYAYYSYVSTVALNVSSYLIQRLDGCLSLLLAIH